MARAIVSKTANDFQLINISIDLIHIMLDIMECDPELARHPKVIRLSNHISKWNKLFVEGMANHE